MVASNAQYCRCRALIAVGLGSVSCKIRGINSSGEHIPISAVIVNSIFTYTVQPVENKNPNPTSTGDSNLIYFAA